MKIWKNDVRLKFKFSLEVSGIFKDLVVPSMKTVLLLRYESSTLILYKELSSPIFQSCE